MRIKLSTENIVDSNIGTTNNNTDKNNSNNSNTSSNSSSSSGERSCMVMHGVCARRQKFLMLSFLYVRASI